MRNEDVYKCVRKGFKMLPLHCLLCFYILLLLLTLQKYCSECTEIIMHLFSCFFLLFFIYCHNWTKLPSYFEECLLALTWKIETFTSVYRITEFALFVSLLTCSFSLPITVNFLILVSTFSWLFIFPPCFVKDYI